MVTLDRRVERNRDRRAVGVGVKFVAPDAIYGWGTGGIYIYSVFNQMSAGNLSIRG